MNETKKYNSKSNKLFEEKTIKTTESFTLSGLLSEKNGIENSIAQVVASRDRDVKVLQEQLDIVNARIAKAQELGITLEDK